MTFVIDASTCLSWVLPDESPTEAAEAARLELRRQPALVPAIWPLEVANTLLVVERRSRLERGASRKLLIGLLRLPILVAAETCELGAEERSWPLRVHEIAQEHALSSYDASYVLLAHHRRLPMATDDEALRRAARRLSVPILGDR